MNKSVTYMVNNSYDFLTRALPGFYCVSQSFIIALHSESFGDIARLMLKRPAVFIFGLSVLSLLAGMCFENWGSTWEAWLRRNVEPEDPNNQNDFYKVWDKYLLLKIEGSPVGHRYLRTLVIRLKFSLGMLVASVFSLIVILLFFAFSFHSLWEAKQLSLLLLLSNILFIFAFYRGSKDLYNLTHYIRKLVLDEYGKRK